MNGARLFACALAVVTAGACASPPPRVPASSRAGAHVLEGRVTLASPAASPAPRGRLVVGYRTAEEQAEVDRGDHTLGTAKRMIARWSVKGDVDFATTNDVTYRIEGAPPDATPVVVLDVDHTFWPTVFGGGSGLVGSGKRGGGDVTLSASSRSAGKEPCEGPRYRLVTIEARGVPPSTSRPSGTTRRFCAWLPEGWSETTAKRWPIAFFVPGFMSTEMAYLRGDGHLGLRADAIAKETKRDVILVGVDTSTPFGSTYLEDSPVQGAFASFFADAIPRLEKELHGIPKRTARALLGQSTGGYNALSFGMRRSDLLSVIGSSSPDGPDLEAWLLEPGTRRMREWLLQWMRLDDELGGPGQLTSYAADWSPDAGAPKRWRWPVALDSGIADENVLARWVAKTPHGLVRDLAFLARVKKDLSGRIFVSVGKNDEFGLYEPAERFAKELNALGVETRFVPTDHGHGNGNDRLESGLRFALERLDVAAPTP